MGVVALHPAGDLLRTQESKGTDCRNAELLLSQEIVGRTYRGR